MKKNLTLLSLSAIITFSFALFQTIHGAEDPEQRDQETHLLQTEQRSKEEWNSLINKTVQYVIKLEGNQLTYGELHKILGNMDSHYMEGQEKRELKIWRNAMCEVLEYEDFDELLNIFLRLALKDNKDTMIPSANRTYPLYRSILMRDIKEMVKRYNRLSNTPHDLSGEGLSYYQHYSWN